MKPWRRTFAAACFAAGLVFACGPGFLDGISGGSAGPPVDSGPSDGEVSDTGPVQSCNNSRPLGPPDAADGPGNTSILFAFDKMRVDTVGDPVAGGVPPVGFDLDNACTCPGVDSCTRPVGQPPACDGTRGQDNALAKLFNALSGTVNLFSKTFATDRILEGHYTVLLEVRSWNGELNDPNVFVSIRLSQQIQKNGTGGRPRPLFDGEDRWTVDPQSIVGGEAAMDKDCSEEVNALDCLPKASDAKAYITNGRLVAHPVVDAAGKEPVTIVVRSGAGSIVTPLVDFTVSADLTGPKGGPYRLDGELSGRVVSTPYVTSLANLQDVTKDGSAEPPICKNLPVFLLLKQSVCAARDIAAPGKDNMGAACDHYSAAISFGAVPARMGRVFRKDSLEPLCGDTIYGCE